MKNFLKNIFIIGPVLVSLSDYLRKLKKRYRQFRWYQEYRLLFQKNLELKDSEVSRRCFILGCGPSIKDQNLDSLQGELCISVSNFFVHPAYKKIKPLYHIFPASHSPITDEQYTAWLEEAEKLFHPGQRILVSARDKYLVDRKNIFKNHKVYYYLSNEFGFKEFKKSIDFTKLLPGVQTATHWAIYLAFYMGAKDIYLLGCDHNWSLDRFVDTKANPEVLASKHFFEYKDYAMARHGYNSAPPNMEDQFKSYLKLWGTYKYIRRYAYDRGINIVNLTPGSLLDLFPRDDLHNILK